MVIGQGSCQSSLLPPISLRRGAESPTLMESTSMILWDWDDCLLRVQVKKANQDNEKPWKYRIFTDRYEAGEVDLFAGHIADTNQFFYATFEEVGSNEFRINSKSSDEIEDYNLEQAKLVEDYTFNRAVSRLCHG